MPRWHTPSMFRKHELSLMEVSALPSASSSPPFSSLLGLLLFPKQSSPLLKALIAPGTSPIP